MSVHRKRKPSENSHEGRDTWVTCPDGEEIGSSHLALSGDPLPQRLPHTLYCHRDMGVLLAVGRDSSCELLTL